MVRGHLDGGRLGAFHTLDIPLVLDNTAQPGAHSGDGDGARWLAALMSEALLAFARNGGRGHAGLPAWPPHRLQHRETMLFDLEPRLEHDPRGGERRLFRRARFFQRGTL